MADHVLVLTAAPERGLSDAELELTERSVGGDARRLAPWAAELPCHESPLLPALDAVDANVLPAEGRQKRALLADMDSTMITAECIDELAAAAGIGEQVSAITERAMAGELDFEGALTERVGLLAGLPEETLDTVWMEHITLSPGARVFVRTMAERGAVTALVSGGFTYFTKRVASACGFAENRANQLEIAGGYLTGSVVPPILGREAKREALREIAERKGLEPTDFLAIGDGANDLAMIEAAGLGVGYRPKPLLAAACDAVLAHSDLRAVLALQGIPEGDFVTD
ncbi:MAG: phosphoserine phosphatase SerB [Pseudomonadota bacterium]